MGTITTLRPSATSSGVGWTATPSGTLHGVTSDDSDSTYALWSGSGSALILATPADSPPVGERRHQARLRIRGEDGDAWGAVRLAAGGLAAGVSAPFTSSPSTVTGSWGFGVPADGSTVLSAYVTGQISGVKIQELYLDVDSRLAPTFTAQTVDGSGTVTTTISDTAQPTIRASGVDLDDLISRQYRYWVTSGADIVWDTGIVAGPSTDRQTEALENGSYVAHLIVWSTLGSDTEYSSDEETVSFTVSVGVIPAPDAPVVTPVEDTAFYEIEACAPDSSGFDSDVSYLEIQRVDCNATVTVAILGPLVTDECATYVDYSFPRTGVGATCSHDPEPCCSYYRARTLGRVDGQLLVSDWSDEQEPVCLVWDEDYHLIRTEGESGPMWSQVGGRFTWDRDRPFTVATGVMGSRFVTSAPPGGRNLKLSAAVSSEAELNQLKAVLARPLVLISPSDSSEVWAAPVASSVRVIKIGRIRQVSAEFTATGPQPSPQLADVGA
jgi:hypothetical protein